MGQCLCAIVGVQLTDLTNTGPGQTTISDYHYELDATGNRTEMTDLSGTHEYVYDALYRLTEVTNPDPETDAYTYDANGNRLTRDTDDYTYDAADQLIDLEGVSYGYDDNGNQTSRESDTFEYDHENRLVQAVIDSVTSTSEYNGDGLRMSLTVDDGTPATTDYAWDVNQSLPVVLDDATNQYVYGLDLISATDANDNQTYFTYDGLGSVTALTDDTGAVTDSYSYDVFGAVRASSGSTRNPWLFTGESFDEASGLYYLRARYYDPAVGIFMTADPKPGQAGMPASHHRYQYVFASPTNGVDPSGLCPLYDPRCIGEKLAGWLPGGIPWRGGRTELLATCIVYMNIPFVDWGRCETVATLGDLAFSLQDYYYGENTEGTPADRFQHCVWSGSIAIVYGSSFARTITGRYEEYPGNDPVDKAFDLQSNRLGYEFIGDLDYEKDSFGLPKDLDSIFGQLVAHCKE